MGYLRASGLLLLLLVACSLGQAQTHALLVDTSKSMRPFYDSGFVRDLSGTIHDVLQSHGNTHILAFNTDVTSFSDLDALSRPALGDFTYLDRAIDYAVRKQYSVAWMLTDNVESRTTDPEAANTEVFYSKLRSNAVKRIVVFPLLQSPGTSGLVIYAMQISPEADEMFDKEIGEFLSQAKGAYRTEALRIKPLDKDTLEVILNQGAAQPNAKSLVFKEGQSIRETLEVRFKSRFEHLEVVDSKIEVPPSKPEFSASSLLAPEKMEVTISPEKVSGLGPQEETEQIYKVTADLGKVKLKKDWRSLWQAAWGGKNFEDIVLNVRFIIRVPHENFKLKQSFVQTYSAESPQAAKFTGKIYGVDKLPLLLSEESTPVIAESSMKFRVEYPWWPAFVWIGLFVLGLGFLIGLAVLVSKGLSGVSLKSGQWSVTAETESGVPLKCESNDGRVTVQGDNVGEISRNFFRPSSNINVEGSADKVKLGDGLSLKINQKGRPAVLTFKKDGTRKADAETSSTHTPRKR